MCIMKNVKQGHFFRYGYLTSRKILEDICYVWLDDRVMLFPWLSAFSVSGWKKKVMIELIVSWQELISLLVLFLA